MRARTSLVYSVVIAAVAAFGATARAETARWGQGYLPNAPLITQDGRSVRFYDEVLKGKIAVISFIYTSCRDICPLVTARLTQVRDKLGDLERRGIAFVSISIDPVTDTPEKLKAFAQAFRIEDSNWVFLTGTSEDINHLRHKLGERTRKLSEHRNEVLLYNDTTGVWERNSAFGDLNVLSSAILAMDPAWHNQAASGAPAASTGSGPGTDNSAADVIAAHAAERPGQGLFVKACAGCHTIGQGDKVGPDLNGVTVRRAREWIARYIKAPDMMRSDPIAVSLGERFKMVRMPNLGLSDEDVDDVIGYLQARSYAVEADKGMAQASDSQAQHHHHHH
jgi:protein SCO1/2